MAFPYMRLPIIPIIMFFIQTMLWIRLRLDIVLKFGQGIFLLQVSKSIVRISNGISIVVII